MYQRGTAPSRPPGARLLAAVILMLSFTVMVGQESATAEQLGAGTLSSYSRLAVTGLGDSVPSGGACNCTSYVTLFGTSAAASHKIPADVTNAAYGGLTSAGLLRQLTSPHLRTIIAASDVVIVTIGANDFNESSVTNPSCTADERLACFRAPLAQLATNLSSALSTIRALTVGRQAAILVTGYWNVFKDGEVARSRGSAYVAGSYALTRAVNALVQAAAERNDATYVDIYTPFNANGTRDDTALLATDGDHPNARGHALIARLLLAAWT